jgi:hypothetical protein
MKSVFGLFTIATIAVLASWLYIIPSIRELVVLKTIDTSVWDIHYAFPPITAYILIASLVYFLIGIFQDKESREQIDFGSKAFSVGVITFPAIVILLVIIGIPFLSPLGFSVIPQAIISGSYVGFPLSIALLFERSIRF